MATKKTSFDWEELSDKTADAARAAAETSWKWTKKFLRKTAQATADSTILLKQLTKRQKFKLSKVETYLHKNELGKLTTLIKQGKANIELKRYGWSFLISGRDLLPVLHFIPPEKRKYIFDDSEEKADKSFILEADKKIQKSFYDYAFNDFSERAWGAVPQYIAPTLVSPVHIKQVIAMQFFCPKDFKVLLKGGRAKKKILASASEIDSSLIAKDIDSLTETESKKILSSKKLLAGSKGKINLDKSGFNVILPVKRVSLRKFTDLVESLVIQEVQINRNDIFFIKRYIKHAQKIKVKISPQLADKIKLFAVSLKKKNKKIGKKTVEGILHLVKASAAMELRNQIKTKDLVRVFKIFNKVY